MEVNFISGKQAVLTIFKDGKEVEKVTLSDYDDKDKLHDLFAEKGFRKFTAEEFAARRIGKLIEGRKQFEAGLPMV